MLRAKKLGFKFKGRTVVEHDALLTELETVRPRARKVVVDKKSKRALADRIEAHLAEGRSLLVAAKDELVQLDKSASDLNAARLALSVKVDLLTAEQKLVDFPSGS
jgi:hypothetical protein